MRSIFLLAGDSPRVMARSYQFNANFLGQPFNRFGKRNTLHVHEESKTSPLLYTRNSGKTDDLGEHEKTVSFLGERAKTDKVATSTLQRDIASNNGC